MKHALFLLAFLLGSMSLSAAITGGIVLDTTIVPDRDQTPFEGGSRFAAEWQDAAGTHRLILSGKVTDDGEGGKEELFAYHYTQKGEKWELLWKIYDFVDGYGCDLQIRLFRDYIRVEDVDGDNIAETAFIYTLDNRCDASVVPTKLLMHHGTRKLAVRGMSDQWLGPDEERLNEILKEVNSDPVKFKAIDPAFEQDKFIFKEYASDLWDALIEEQAAAHR